MKMTLNTGTRTAIDSDTEDHEQDPCKHNGNYRSGNNHIICSNDPVITSFQPERTYLVRERDIYLEDIRKRITERGYL
jgi:hypothetical protein